MKFKKIIRKLGRKKSKNVKLNEAIDGFSDITDEARGRVADAIDDAISSVPSNSNEIDIDKASHKSNKRLGGPVKRLRAVKEYKSKVGIGSDNSRNIIINFDMGYGENQYRYPTRRIGDTATYKYVKKHLKNDIAGSNRMAFTKEYPAKSYIGVFGRNTATRDSKVDSTEIGIITRIQDDPHNDVIKAGTVLSDLLPNGYKSAGKLYDADEIKKRRKFVFTDLYSLMYNISGSFTDYGLSMDDLEYEDREVVKEKLVSGVDALAYEIVDSLSDYIVVKPEDFFDKEKSRRSGKVVGLGGKTPGQLSRILNSSVDLTDYQEFLSSSFTLSSAANWDESNVYRGLT